MLVVQRTGVKAKIMNKNIISILQKNSIIKNKEDIEIIELENTNPFKNNVIRIFSRHRNKNYILKKCNYEEVRNLKFASDLLLRSNKRNIKILSPLSTIGNFFIFEYLGTPLNRKKIINRNNLFIDVVHINNFFLENGYFWGGLALRNIFFLDNKYILIDFEKLFKIKGSVLDRRNLLFLKLNLLQSFNRELVDGYIDFLEEKYIFSNEIRKMDKVEIIGWRTASFKSRNDFFNYFDNLTIETERPFMNSSRPFNICHIIDEATSAEISFLWTLLMSRKRKDGAESFRQLLNSVEKILDNKNIETTKFNLCALIIALGDQKKYYRIIEKIKMASTHNDYKMYDDIMANIINAICELIKIDSTKINVVARGSYGECILTKESDLDFEVIEFKNNTIHPLVFLENFVHEILSCFKIKSDGTKGRPKERDVVIGKDSRDLFEIFELRLVCGDKKSFCQYLDNFKRIVYDGELWKNKTEYEKKHRALNVKSLFEDIRFLITRLALENNKKKISSKSFDKIRMSPKNVRKELMTILGKVINMRNTGNKEIKQCQTLLKRLDKIKFEHELIACNLLVNNEKKSSS